VRVALFVPCYVDQLAPDVAAATVRVLRRVGCEVSYDPDQTCCGQPLLTLGAATEATRVAQAHLARFARSRADAVVCPSGSCAATVRERFSELGVGEDAAGRALRGITFELGEFLVRRLGVTDVGAAFPHRVALLASCHGLRDLGLGMPSEHVGAPRAPGTTESLLAAVRGLELVRPERDECCGFGGAFSVKVPEVSVRMGRARVRALAATGAEFVVSTDTSCLLHLDGIRRRSGEGPRPIHLAEILAAAAP
jgi:L-lactate dehydrogenase complex protein LldE